MFGTVPKLIGMARIVGWIAGAVHYSGVVDEVWRGTGAYGVANYNVRWTLMQSEGQPPVSESTSARSSLGRL